MYPHDHPKSTLSLEVLKKYSNNVFLETGSNMGEGIQIAIDAGFKRIISFDIEEKYVNICKNRFISNNSVQVFLGDSGTDIYKFISDINESITFWLDGHGYYSVPLLNELEQINKHHLKNHTILIDDVRMFSNDLWNNLSQESVLNKIKQINDKYIFSYEDSFNAKNDILVAKIK